MIGELVKIAGQCDGVRCDMAMLVLPEVFERTWGTPCAAFWPKRPGGCASGCPGFCFMAEVYWDLEWTLQQQGFDYTYDKRLYDRLREGHARPVREHLHAGLDYQNKLARFLENHDEPRAAATFPPEVHEAAAVITFLSPGLRFFHQGQFEGRKKRISPHLVRGPDEPVDETLQQFYDSPACRAPPAGRSRRPMATARMRSGLGRQLDIRLFHRLCMAGCGRRAAAGRRELRPYQSQCYVRLPFSDLSGRTVRLEDLMGPASYDRTGNELLAGDCIWTSPRGVTTSSRTGCSNERASSGGRVLPAPPSRNWHHHRTSIETRRETDRPPPSCKACEARHRRIPGPNERQPPHFSTPITKTSTRRFFARPSSVLLSAIGLASPEPADLKLCWDRPRDLSDNRGPLPHAAAKASSCSLSSPTLSV